MKKYNNSQIQKIAVAVTNNIMAVKGTPHEDALATIDTLAYWRVEWHVYLQFYSDVKLALFRTNKICKFLNKMALWNDDDMVKKYEKMLKKYCDDKMENIAHCPTDSFTNEGFCDFMAYNGNQMVGEPKWFEDSDIIAGWKGYRYTALNLLSLENAIFKTQVRKGAKTWWVLSLLEAGIAEKIKQEENIIFFRVNFGHENNSKLRTLFTSGKECNYNLACQLIAGVLRQKFAP